MIKKLNYFFEFLILYFFFLILKMMPITLVSIVGGKIFKFCGPFSNKHNIALKNLNKVFPSLGETEIKKILMKSWENIGKTFIEFSILNKILESDNKIQIQGKKYLEKIKKNNEQVIFFGIHQANWELFVPTIDKFGIKVGAVYRHINNPFINSFILKKRNKTLKFNQSFYTPKGKKSAMDMLHALNKDFSLLFIIDQKDSAGNKIKLFNHDVKTQIGFLKIALKYKLKLVPMQVLRVKTNNFKIIFHKPFNPFLKRKSETLVMKEIHNMIEKWIKQSPEQWFWQHKRFD